MYFIYNTLNMNIYYMLNFIIQIKCNIQNYKFFKLSKITAYYTEYNLEN